MTTESKPGNRQLRVALVAIPVGLVLAFLVSALRVADAVSAVLAVAAVALLVGGLISLAVGVWRRLA